MIDITYLFSEGISDNASEHWQAQRFHVVVELEVSVLVLRAWQAAIANCPRIVGLLCFVESQRHEKMVSEIIVQMIILCSKTLLSGVNIAVKMSLHVVGRRLALLKYSNVRSIEGPHYTLGKAPTTQPTPSSIAVRDAWCVTQIMAGIMFVPEALWTRMTGIRCLIGEKIQVRI